MMSAPAAPPPPPFFSQAIASLDKWIAEREAELVRLRVENEELKHALAQKPKWATGCRGDGVAKVPGFTVTETRILRILAASGRVTKEQLENGNALYRHMSNIKRKIREMPALKQIKIRTDIGQGYDVDNGQDILRLLVEGKPVETKPRRLSVPRLPAPRFEAAA
jgi:hypothetical protein